MKKYNAAMRNFIIKRTRGEAANPPVLFCDHWHCKSEMLCKHNQNPYHDRSQCDFMHEGPCPARREDIPCFHDGTPNHESQVPDCKFRHVKSFQKVAAPVPAPMPVAQPQSPFFNKDDDFPDALAQKADAVKWADVSDPELATVKESRAATALKMKELAAAILKEEERLQKEAKLAQEKAQLAADNELVAQMEAKLAALKASKA